MSRFGSMEPVGILKAWTTNVLMKSARTTAMTSDSKYSRGTDFLNGSIISCGGPPRRAARASFPFRPHLQHGQKRLLRNVDLPDPLHALLPFFLLLEQLALTRDISPIALGEHVLAKRLDGLTRNDSASDCSLDRHLEHLSGNQLAHLGRQRTPALICCVAVHDHRQRVDGISVDEDVHLHQRRVPV